MKPVKITCLKCHLPSEISDYQIHQTSNNRYRAVGSCTQPDCGAKLNAFISLKKTEEGKDSRQ